MADEAPPSGSAERDFTGRDTTVITSACLMRALTEQDREVMQRNIRNGILFALPACFFFVLLGAAIVYLFWNEGLTKFKYFVGMLGGVMMSTMGAFFCKLVVVGLRAQRAELRAGVKAVLSGRVTDKRISDTKNVDSTEVMFRRADHIRRWYLTVEDEEFEVEKVDYDRFELGSRVAVHLAPDTGLLLRMEALA